jgi:transitional endoplasmic reticulum ATPase
VSKSDKTAQQLEVERLLNDLATIGGKLTAEEDIIFQGKKLILPETMNLREAIKFLEMKETEDEQHIGFSRDYLYRPWDGARASMRALKRAFGATMQKGVPTFFGEIPPRLITINVSATETEQVPWGRLVVPHLKGVELGLGATKHHEYGKIFQVSAEGPRKYRFEIEGIFRLIEEELKRDSLYRGKSFDGQENPSFLDLRGVSPDKVIYSDETTLQMEANIWSLLRYSDQMEELGVPLKRACLLEGPYGTGKTLAAYLTAQVAEQYGWTFILCRPGRDSLFDVMSTARLYQPSVVFFEDVDVIAQAGTDHTAQLLDIFDGIQSKGTKIICVLTTNHVEKIHKGMVRPGRLDAVIHVGALDQHGIQRLILATVPDDLLAPDLDWTAIASAMDGFLPAFCRESIDRTVRYNVARNGGVATKLDTADFVGAAQGLRPQLELMEGAKETADHDTMASAMTKIVTQVVKEKVDQAQIVDGDGDWMYSLRLPEDPMVAQNGR